MNPIHCLAALNLMVCMPAAVIEKHIGSVMLLLNNKEEEDSELLQKFCLDVITKLAPEKLASLNLKPQIAAISLAKSNFRYEREQVAKLLKTIPD